MKVGAQVAPADDNEARPVDFSAGRVLFFYATVAWRQHSLIDTHLRHY
jgi:hypothetical protein